MQLARIESSIYKTSKRTERHLTIMNLGFIVSEQRKPRLHILLHCHTYIYIISYCSTVKCKSHGSCSFKFICQNEAFHCKLWWTSLVSLDWSASKQLFWVIFFGVKNARTLQSKHFYPLNHALKQRSGFPWGRFPLGRFTFCVFFPSKVVPSLSEWTNAL